MRVFYVYCFALCVVVINCDNESSKVSTKTVKKSVLPRRAHKRQGIGGYAPSARGYPSTPRGGAESYGAPRRVGGGNEYSSPPPSYGSVPSNSASRGGGSYGPYNEGPQQPNRGRGGGGDGYLHSTQHPAAIHMDQRDMQDFSMQEQPDRQGGRGGYERQGGSNGGNDYQEAPNGGSEPSQDGYEGGGDRGYEGQQTYSGGGRNGAQPFHPDDGMTMSGFNNLGGHRRSYGGSKYARSKIPKTTKTKRKQKKGRATKRSMLQRSLYRRASTPGSTKQGTLQTRQLGQASMQPQQLLQGSLQTRQLGPGMGGMHGNGGMGDMQGMGGMGGMHGHQLGGSMSHYHPINVGSEAIKHIQPAVPAINIAPQQKFIDIPATRGAITVQPRVPLVHLSAPRKTINALSHADAVHINSPSTVYHRPPIVFHKPQVVGCEERGLPPGCDDMGGEHGGYGGEYGSEEHRGEEEGEGSVSSYGHGQRDEVPLGAQYGEYQKRDRIQTKKRTKSKKHHKKKNKTRARRFEIVKPIEHVQSQNERRSPKPSDKDDAPVFFVDGSGSMHRVNNDVASNPINLLHPPCFTDSGSPCLNMEPHVGGGLGGFGGQGMFHGGGDVRGYGAGLAGGSPCDHHGCDHHGMPLGGAYAASAYGEHTEPGTSVVGSPMTTGNAGVTAGHLPLIADVPIQHHMSPAYAHYPTIGDGEGRSTHAHFPGISNIGVNPGAHGDMRFQYGLENAIPEGSHHLNGHHGGYKKKSSVSRLEDSIEEDELDKSTERVSKSIIPREEDDHVRVHKDAIPRPYMM